jgi:hypothetical protein
MLAICDFDHRFAFVVAGWLGSAHDICILNCNIEKYPQEFPTPPDGIFSHTLFTRFTKASMYLGLIFFQYV